MSSPFFNNAGLNTIQLEGVNSISGPCLLLAGAGSGKTRVLTYKIAHLIKNHHISPNRILAVTFTNKAAKEMKERVGQLIGSAENMKWVGTFHSICVRILRIYGDKIGYSNNFTIYDSDDQKKIVKQILKLAEEPDHGIQPGRLKQHIGYCKNKSISPTKDKEMAENEEDYRLSFLYQKYQEELIKQNAMDFDDLINNVILLLKQDNNLKQKWQDYFQYLFVDEYQDTNKSQFLLVSLLLGSHQNITVVGDEDQSIYGWRGADISNILSFQKIFSKAKVIKMEQNYRSTSNIIGLAGSVIKNNTERLGKTVWTNNTSGDLVDLKFCEDDISEGRWIAHQINQSEFKFKDIAIFYRTNSQSRILEDGLRYQRIPYVIFGGTRFYDRKEIKDILAYLHIINNSKDNINFLRIINTPKRNIGDKSIEKLIDIAIQNSISYQEALLRFEEWRFPNGFKKKISPFATLIKKLTLTEKEMDLPNFIEEVITSSGYLIELESSNDLKTSDRVDNIQELVSAGYDFQKRNPDLKLQHFLEEVSLATSVDNAQGNGVSLMTIHSSKGLEFQRVFLAGAEENLFPISDEEKELEEERRLFYVAVTRAEKKLSISTCSTRRIWGKTSFQTPSRFLEEADQKYFNSLDIKPTNSFKKTPQSWENSFDNKPSNDDYINQDIYQEGQLNHPFKKGLIVQHNHFGQGKIISLRGEGEDTNITIRFASGVRKLKLKYANLSF